jgi:uncharacterized protein (UPF0332 family)
MVRDGLIKPLPVDPKRVKRSFELAERDLKTAKKVLEESPDWAFSIAYNSMLQATRALMFSKGYRPAGDKHHVSAVKFAESVLGRGSQLVVAFDRMRRKRHVAVYDVAGAVSKTDAENAIRWAGKFLSEARKILKDAGFI